MNDDLTPADARQRLVAMLTAKGWISTPQVARAFATVPRHLFAPAGTSMRAAYADDVVITKRDPYGRATSSISAPWLQAHMIEAAQLGPGSRVLEIGSGGCQAALLAEIGALVTSIDIDPDVIDNARAALTRAGYPDVRLAVADAEAGYPGRGPYDAIIVSVEAGDVPPSWIQQLAPDGVIVVPLRIRGHTRCLTLRRQGDHLAATTALQCGFVAMQGDDRRRARRLPLRADDVVLMLDDPATDVPADALAAALDRPRWDVWSPVTITMTEHGAFESLHLWLASQPRPYGVLAVDRQRTAGLLDPQDRFACPTLLAADSLAYLAVRTVDDTRWQFGAHGFGPGADRLTADMIDLIGRWDRRHRYGPGPAITVHPAGAARPGTDRLRLLVPRRHSLTAITWPDGDQR